MRFGLKDKELHSIISLLEKYPKVKKVYVYGSRASDTYKKTSDIDLSFEITPPDRMTLIHLEHDLEELPIIYEIDLLDESSLKDDEFSREYQKTKKLLYTRNETTSMP